ncbi:MAG: hypothetical protein M5R36_25905 [Deltaproteobacteria bacterium]|nr:hypothetical protein [Deltaproteobacteria bacterium]
MFVPASLLIDGARSKKVIEALAQWATDPTPVIQQAKKFIANKEFIRQNLDDQARSLHRQLAEVEKALKRILDAYQDGLLDHEELTARAKPLKSEKQILEGEIDRLRKEAGIDGDHTHVDLAKLQASFSDFSSVFEGLHIGEQKEMLATVVRKIVAMPEGRLDIHLDFNVLREAFGFDGQLQAMPKDGDLVVTVNTSEEIHMVKKFEEMTSFGERVEWLRTRHRLTKKELARQHRRR